MHHPVTAESIGTDEILHIFNQSENGVVIWRHLVETRPAASDFRIGQARHTANRMLTNSSEVIPIGLLIEARWLVSIGLAHQHASTFLVHVDSRTPVNEHGKRVWDPGQGL